MTASRLLAASASQAGANAARHSPPTSGTLALCCIDARHRRVVPHRPQCVAQAHRHHGRLVLRPVKVPTLTLLTARARAPSRCPSRRGCCLRQLLQLHHAQHPLRCLDSTAPSRTMRLLGPSSGSKSRMRKRSERLPWQPAHDRMHPMMINKVLCLQPCPTLRKRFSFRRAIPPESVSASVTGPPPWAGIERWRTYDYLLTESTTACRDISINHRHGAVLMSIAHALLSLLPLDVVVL
mmetsp:Transcript_53617/g.138608  ORF Transcript_53617/g.138608 Transcript_53617/m.138608 type:complete len:238 (+) Transcript_53617:1693-2406(+)